MYTAVPMIDVLIAWDSNVSLHSDHEVLGKIKINEIWVIRARTNFRNRVVTLFSKPGCYKGCYN